MRENEKTTCLIQILERGLEAKKLQQEVQEAQLSEEEGQGRISEVKGGTGIQDQTTLRLEHGTKAVERSLGQATKQWQRKRTGAVD